jgi:hypothetical protein
MKKFLFLLALATHLALAAAAPHITSPEEAFGFKPGTDRKLADWPQLTAYYRKLASESDRVRYAEIGKTTEGRPFVVLTISAPENLAHLAHYLDIQRRLADPRITSPDEARELIAEDRAVVMVTCAIHSEEIGSSQSASEFAYMLASGDTPQIQAILRNDIVILVPAVNPDGEQLVVDWYKKYVGTPYEGVSPVVLWHKYVGHDDNRDWITFTQVEIRLTAELVNKWHPQILYDLHQQGAYGARLFLPPWVDPIDPNVDPLLEVSMNALGANTALEVAATGKTGVLSYGVYDLWSPLRDYIAYHNGLRVLTESASANLASPIYIPPKALTTGIGYDARRSSWNFANPWPGGWWRLGDIVDYQIDAFLSILDNAAVYRERYLTNFYQVGRNAVNRTSGPYAYVIPASQPDEATTARLINTLRTAAVEVGRADTDFDADGKHYSRGTYIVPLNQPYGSFAKTVLEIQHYPNIPQYPGGPLQRPYDVTAQTLPLLFGVNAVAVENKFSASTTPVTSTVRAAPGRFERSSNGHGYLIADHTNSSLYALFSLLKEGARVYRLTGGDSEPGTIYVPRQRGIDAKLTALADQFPISIEPAQQEPQGDALRVHLPRIALYQSWVPSMDEGWTRWIFDQNHIPYARVVDADIRKGDLNRRFDVVIIPDAMPKAIIKGHGMHDGRGAGAPVVPPEFRGGLGPQGLANLQTFARDGGTIVTLNKASGVYATKKAGDVVDVLANVTNKNFYIPGSILQIAVNTSNPIGFGSTPTVPIFFEQGPAFQVSGNAQSIASYASDNPLLSGWILGGKYLKGQSAIVEEPVGKGRIILFGFRPQYRAQAEVTYKLFFNALLYSSSGKTSL